MNARDWGVRIEALPYVPSGNTRRAVTDSAVRREMFRADQKLSGIVEPRWHFDVGGVKLDRPCACRFQNPARDRGIVFACRHVEKTGVDEGEPPNNDKGDYDRERDHKAAHTHRHQNQTRTPNANRKSPALSPVRFAKLAVWPNLPS